jgi:hypothetical protein
MVRSGNIMSEKLLNNPFKFKQRSVIVNTKTLYLKKQIKLLL